MQIYMKPTQKERTDLLRRIKAARDGLRLSYAVLAERADVDPSQASRICRGKFATFSDSVVRICTVLGVQMGDAVSMPSGTIAGNGPKKTNVSWDKLERAVRRAWDKTPRGADRLAKVIAAVGEVAKI